MTDLCKRLKKRDKISSLLFKQWVENPNGPETFSTFYELIDFTNWLVKQNIDYIKATPSERTELRNSFYRLNDPYLIMDDIDKAKKSDEIREGK